MARLAVGLLFPLLLATAGCQWWGGAALETKTLQTRLASAAAPRAVGDREHWGEIRKFYSLRENKPLWIRAGRPKSGAKELTTLLAAAADEGLNPQEYGVDEIPARLEALKALREDKKAKDKKKADAAIDLELYLTSALLRYSSHVALGHPIAAEVDRNWIVKPRAVDVVGVVSETVLAGDLDELPAKLAPPHPEYARLKEMLRRYREIAAGGKVQPVPTHLKLKAGAPSPHLATLRNNLLILGDLQEKAQSNDNVFDEDLSEADAEFKRRHAAQPDETPDPAKVAVVEKFDDDLVEAVRRFEARHGLEPDGVPDPAMIAAMNVTPEDRASQLALNLERWRWLPADLGLPHIFVNIAGYRLQVRDANQQIPVKMRVIVGKATQRTPVFSDTMTTVVFSPYWNIPESIEANEMLPRLEDDEDFLVRQRIEVIQGADGNVQLRQRPGPGNALGYVKFLFPNRFNVYLHDTPTDNLFDRLTRSLSHGCVRLEHPVELATYLLRDQPEWTAEKIKSAMHAGVEKQVALNSPLPVHIVYLTARVDEDGVPQFFDDVYGYDRKQQALLGLRQGQKSRS